MDEQDIKNIDYAFFPCDGVYTITVDEATKAAHKVNARYSIPYHMVQGGHFSEEIADKFNVKNKLIIKPNEEIDLE